MKITISGKPGSGKSTVAKALAKEFNLKHYSVGNFMRQIAEKRNMSLIELSKIAESDKSVDKELDSMTKSLNNQDDFVIDSRLAFHFIPDSIKIYLDVSLDEAAKRIFKDKRKGEKEKTIEQLKFQIKRRIDSERKRYLEYYHVYIDNANNYDLIVDTTSLTKKQVLEKVIEFIKNFQDLNT